MKLLQSIHELIARTPLFDIHTHLGVRGTPYAECLADIVGYHWVWVELRRAGCDLPRWKRGGDGEAWMEEAAPYFAQTFNTSNHYCLMAILRDLYGFDERHITPDNWRELDQAVRRRAAEPGRFQAVMDTSNIGYIMIPYMPGGNPAADGCGVLYENGEQVIKRLMGDDTRGHRDEVLTLPSVSDVRVFLQHELEETAGERQCRALHVYMHDDWVFDPCGEHEADDLLARIHAGEAPNTEERLRLIPFLMDLLVGECGRHGLAVQIFIGMSVYDGVRAEGIASRYLPAVIPGLAAMTQKYPETPLDVFSATRMPSHEMANVARCFRNLSFSGGWWHGFTPQSLTMFYRDRLEILPHTCWSAFFSDAYIADWLYGKAALARDRLARALAELVEEGLLAEDDLPTIATALLHDNAMEKYHVKNLPG